MGNGLVKVLFDDGTMLIGTPKIQKYDPDQPRAANGEFGSGGGSPKFSERQASIQAEIDDINQNGGEFQVGAATWDKNFPGVSPKEFVTGISGYKPEDGRYPFWVKPEMKEGEVTSSRVIIQNLGSYRVGDAQINTFDRTVDPVNKNVHHELLEVHASTQGAGAVKEIFRTALPLYDKMGMKTLDLYANLDAGGYAWARYGFRAVSSLGVNSGEFAIRKSLQYTDALVKEQAPKLSADAMAEYVDYKLAARRCLGPECMTQFTSLSTPKLDAELHAELRFVKPQLAQPSLTQAGMDNVSWHGRISLNKADGQRDRLDRYVGL